MKKNGLIIAILLFVFVFLLLFKAFCFTVAETDQVLIVRFGEVKRSVKDAGLHFRVPVLDEIKVFEKRVLEWDGQPARFTTIEKKYINLDTFARWKISDPKKYYTSLGNEAGAQKKLDDEINSVVSEQISKNDLIEVVRNSNREMIMITESQDEEEDIAKQREINYGRDILTRRILSESSERLKKFGIDLVDIQIKRINYEPEVRSKVYDRMRAERASIAAKFRSEGNGLMMEIRGKKEKREAEILSEAYKKSEEIRGQADAEAIRVYAEAYSRDPEFYSFLRSLETYKDNLGNGGRLILSTDSDYLKYLTEPGTGK